MVLKNLLIYSINGKKLKIKKMLMLKLIPKNLPYIKFLKAM